MQSTFIGILTYIVSFYSLHFQDIDGNTISMNNFMGKKVLISNIATGSILVRQLGEFKLLQQQYHDSLVIILFPSNSFGKEPRNNNEIKSFCDSAYQPNFIIAAKTEVTGPNANEVFKWLNDSTKNGEFNSEVINNYQKFLVGSTGTFLSVLSPKLSPTDSLVHFAINRAYN